MIILTLLATRQPSQIINPQFYADDGSCYFGQVAAQGWDCFFSPYNGYYQLLPRLIAQASSSISWSWTPIIYTYTSFALAAYVACRVICSPLPRIAALGGGIAIVMVPGQGEALGNLCCVQFILNTLILLAFLCPQESSFRSRMLRCGEVVICCLTGPFCIIFIPVVMLLCWGQKKDRWLTASFAVATAVQLGVVLCNPRPTYGFFSAILQAIEVTPYYLRDLFTIFLHERPQPDGLITGLCCGALLGALIAWPGQKNRLPVLALWGGAAGLLLASRIANSGWPNAFGNGSRYTYLPFILLLWSIFWLAQGTRSRPAWVLAFFLVIMVVLNTAYCWQGRVFPDLEWKEQVREAQQGTRTHFVIPATPVWSFPVPNQDRPHGPAEANPDAKPPGH